MIFRRAFAFFLVLLLAIPAVARPPQTRTEVRSALAQWNERASHADLDGFMALFDDTSEDLLVGSAPDEVFRGKHAVRTWLASLFAHNRFSWDLSRAHIDSNGTTAWVFVDGSMTVTSDKGETRTMPYRFSGVLVKRGRVWKWRLFHGSAPEQPHSTSARPVSRRAYASSTLANRSLL